MGLTVGGGGSFPKGHEDLGLGYLESLSHCGLWWIEKRGCVNKCVLRVPSWNFRFSFVSFFFPVEILWFIEFSLHSTYLQQSSNKP